MTHAVHSITNSCFLILPIDVVHCILNGLDVKSLIQFERAYPGHDSLTKHAWSCHRARDFFLCDWSFLDKHPQADKWSYVLSKLLFRHFIYFNLVLRNQDQNKNRASAKRIHQYKNRASAKKIYQQSRHLIELFPLWGCYIEKNLYDIQGQMIPVQLQKRQQELKQELAGKVQEGKWGGDLLLKGLFELEDVFIQFEEFDDGVVQDVFNSFTKAIEQKATCASCFALYLPMLADWKESLICAAAKQGDYKAVKAVELMRIDRYPDKARSSLQSIQNKIKKLLPNEPKWEQADDYYTEVIKTAEILEALENQALNDALPSNEPEGEQEEVYSGQFLKALSKNRSLDLDDILLNAAHVKYQLKHFEAADFLYEKILKKLGEDETPVDVLEEALQVKIKLNREEEALAFRDLIYLRERGYIVDIGPLVDSQADLEPIFLEEFLDQLALLDENGRRKES